jgi:hypothetical protein
MLDEKLDLFISIFSIIQSRSIHTNVWLYYPSINNRLASLSISLEASSSNFSQEGCFANGISPLMCYIIEERLGGKREKGQVI